MASTDPKHFIAEWWVGFPKKGELKNAAWFRDVIENICR